MNQCNDSVFLLRDYGKVQVNLKNIMDARGITRNALAKKINTRFEVISRWYNGDVESMDLDILARILFVLDCSIEDILSYEKPQG